MKAHFLPCEIHLESYKDPVGFWGRRIYEYEADEDKPLTFISEFGTRWQPDRHFLTDMGSIPALVSWGRLSKDYYLKSYLMHDCAYRHGYLWTWRAYINRYEKCHLDKQRADDLLYEMLRAEGAYPHTAWIIYRAVRAASPWVEYPQAVRP